jgi:multidrug efflux pump subunit AcrA (membrane-fusion protein)
MPSRKGAMNRKLVEGSPLPADGTEKSYASGQRPRYGRYLLVAVVVIAVLLLVGWWPKHKQNEQVQAKANQQKASLPIVEVVTASEVPQVEELTLPGTVVPVSTTHIYARATGYLKTLNADIGDRVRRSQLLAVIESPDLDAAVQQQQSLVQVSKATLNTARSQLALQQVTYDRVHTLAQHGVLSQQDDDVALAAVKAATDAVQSAENNVNAETSALERWTVLASYEQVRSPIDGTVTARNVDVGSFVTSSGAGAGLLLNTTSVQSNSGGPPTGGAQGGELFQITNTHNLQTFISVPEEDAVNVQTGHEATLTFSELPGQQFDGKIIRSSDSLNQQTRTLLLEVQIQDPNGRLRPGMFASVRLHFNVQNPGILISGDSIIPRAQGQFVAVVDNNVVHLQQVHVGRDLGTEVYVTTGLRNGDKIVVNPTDSVQEGVHVQTKAAPKGQER